ncbi:MAG: hypothetical protein AAF517_26780, partial [Planctomycetota bacterium]
MERELKDYLLEHEGYDWGKLLRPWRNELPREFTLWFLNRFADVFFVTSDGSVHILDLGGQTTRRLAS